MLVLLVELALAAVLPLPTTGAEAAVAALLLAVLTAPVVLFAVIRPYVRGRERIEAALRGEIEERRRMEADLQQLSLAVEQSPASVVITDASERITYVNPRFTELTGYSAEEAIGQTPALQRSGQTPAETYEQMWEALKAGQVWRGEFLNRRRDGSLYHEQAAIGAVQNERGEVTSYVAVKLDISEQKRLEEELRAQAASDPLTGIFNRRRFLELAQAELARARRYRRPVAVLMVDVDRFKQINDTWGHAAGDDALRRLVAGLEIGLREQDLLGRVGGEEFAILLPETDMEPARAVAHRLCERIAQDRFQTAEGLVRLTVSIGLVVSRSGSLTLEEAMSRADQALYDAKRSGRNRVSSLESSDGLQMTAESGQRS